MMLLTKRAPIRMCRCTCNTTLFVSGTFRDVRVFTDEEACPDQDLTYPTPFCRLPAAAVAGVTGAEGSAVRPRVLHAAVGCC